MGLQAILHTLLVRICVVSIYIGTAAPPYVYSVNVLLGRLSYFLCGDESDNNNVMA